MNPSQGTRRILDDVSGFQTAPSDVFIIVQLIKTKNIEINNL
jgi:hypothetical protein